MINRTDFNQYEMCILQLRVFNVLLGIALLYEIIQQYHQETREMANTRTHVGKFSVNS